MYFRLKDVEYTVKTASVSFGLNPSNQNLKMYISIEAESDSKSIDFELSNVILYHNNGFDIGGKTLRNLNGKRFEWKNAENNFGEEAGSIYVLEHEEITSGVIEILDVTKDTIKIKWTGKGNIFWNDDYYKDVPFEAEIEAVLPDIPKYKVLNGMEKDRIKIDKNTEVVLLNFDDILSECNRCREMWQNDDRDAWNKYNAILNFILIYKGTEYQGKAVYNGSAVKCDTVLDENCPVKIQIIKTTIDTAFNKYCFYFLCE